MCSRFSCVAAGMKRLSLDITEAVKNVAGLGVFRIRNRRLS